SRCNRLQSSSARDVRKLDRRRLFVPWSSSRHGCLCAIRFLWRCSKSADVGNYIVNSLIPAEESSHCSHLLAVLIVAVIASDTIPEIFQLGGKIAALHARQPWRACTPDALTLLPVTNGAIAIQCLAVVGATRQTRR